MSLPDGDVALYEVLEWAQEQSQYLPNPAQRLVLWYLCVHAWRVEENPEDREVGDVLSAFTTVYRIQRATGLSNATVRRVLTELQEEGYLFAQLRPGNGKSTISVFWSEGADKRREDYRAGIRPLPKGFKKAPKEPQPEPKSANVIPIRSAHGERNMCSP